MFRRKFAALFAVFALCAALDTAHAKPLPGERRIGYLATGSAASHAGNINAFREGMRDLGWVDGKSVSYEFRFTAGNSALLPKFAAELVSLNVDLIVVSSTPAALAAKRATTTIPIVMQFVADPVGSGVVDSLSHPKGNITGSTHMGFELRAKYLGLLKETIPNATRLAVLWNPANPVHVASVKVLEETARALDVQLQMAGARNAAEIETAFTALAQKKAQALAVLPDGLFSLSSERIVTLATQNRLPTLFGGFNKFVQDGGLMSYGVDFPDMARRSAYFVDRIMKGARPSELPVERPTRFEFVINLNAARKLGLAIPQSILMRATEVIQ